MSDGFGTYPTVEVMENREPGAIPITFDVDLRRDEFVKFSKVMTQMSSPKTYGCAFIGRSRIGMFIPAVVCIVLMAEHWRTSGEIDSLLFALFFVYTLSCIWNLIALPRRIMNQARMDYDEVLLNGQTYFGRVMIFPNRVEKHSERNNVTIMFGSDVQYLEMREMIVFSSPNHPSIIIPARCIPEELAVEIRKLAAAGISQEHNGRMWIKSEFVSIYEGPIALPVMPSEGDDLSAVNVYAGYTKSEFYTQAIENGFRAFSDKLLLHCILASIVSIYTFMTAGIFLAVIAFPLLLVAIMSGMLIRRFMRAASVWRADEDHGISVTMRASEAGFIFRIYNRDTPVYVAWQMLDRAVERPSYIEFYFSDQILRIPKRCMNDNVVSEIREMTNRNLNLGN